MNPKRTQHLLFVGLLLIALSATSCSSSSSAQSRPNENEALDRLRQRIDEVETPVGTIMEPVAAEPADVGGGSAVATGGSAVATGGSAVATGGADLTGLMLEPRFGGALPDDDPRVLGVFRFRDHPDPFIDGDTVAVLGLDASLRLLGIDAEETFYQNDENRPRAYSDYESYLEIIYGDADAGRFPKFATPMGMVAEDFCHQFFAGDTEVRLELDDRRRTRGYYDRFLVYVFALRGGQWVNYNVESVRAGVSPYFSKYGYSSRFHDEFVEAQNEAREAERGIWDPVRRHYPDYEARLVWWNRRADAIAHFQTNYLDNPAYFEVGVNAEWFRLAEAEGETITVFGTLGDFHFDWDPARVGVSHRRGDDFTLVGFRQGVFDSYDLDRFRGEYVYIRGQLAFYEEKPQFVVDRGIEIWTEP